MADKSGEYAKWRSASTAKRDLLGLPPLGCAEAKPWTSRGETQPTGVANSERQRDNLDLCFAAEYKRETHGRRRLSAKAKAKAKVKAKAIPTTTFVKDLSAIHPELIT